MKAFGSKTPKRTVVYANTRHIKQLDCGPMKREALTSSVRTTRTYVSKNGQKRFAGSENLKGTQPLDTYHLGKLCFFPSFYLNAGILLMMGPQKNKIHWSCVCGTEALPMAIHQESHGYPQGCQNRRTRCLSSCALTNNHGYGFVFAFWVEAIADRNDSESLHQLIGDHYNILEHKGNEVLD